METLTVNRESLHRIFFGIRELAVLASRPWYILNEVKYTLTLFPFGATIVHEHLVVPEFSSVLPNSIAPRYCPFIVTLQSNTYKLFKF